MFANPAAASVAELVFGEEARDAMSSAELVEALRRVEEKLGRTLSPVVGDSGFRAMFSRALRKNRVTFASLHELLTTEDAAARLDELWERLAREPAAVVRDIATAVIRTLFELLSTFIGDELALRLFHSVWPEAVAAAQTSAPVEK